MHERRVLPLLRNIGSCFNNTELDSFRKALLLEHPFLMQNDVRNVALNSIPAAIKWFSSRSKGRKTISEQYLGPFSSTILPYELYAEKNQATKDKIKALEEFGTSDFKAILSRLGADSGPFHRFDAPLSLFLQVCKDYTKLSPNLYIAQAEISDLPQELQDDLPTPMLVKEAGRGDIYGANIWLGIPPTYTPLHKDPNPNLFIQLAGQKSVRLFGPRIGGDIFRDVQQRVGNPSSSAAIRGEEMMQSPERDVLEDAVWGLDVPLDGFQTILSPGDALYIPKGWWHSIKSEGPDINASVNWWFR